MARLKFILPYSFIVEPRGAETRGGWGNISPPILWLYPPNSLRMVHICILPNNLRMGLQLSVNLGEKSVLFLLKTFFFFFGLHLNSERKSVLFLMKTFFLVFTWISIPEQNRGRGSSPSMLKIGQNWDKIANYPPQCSTKIGTTGWTRNLFIYSPRYCHEKRTKCAKPRPMQFWYTN